MFEPISWIGGHLMYENQVEIRFRKVEIHVHIWYELLNTDCRIVEYFL